MPAPRYKVLEFDRLQMYFGKPYTIDLQDTEGSITIKIPTLKDLIEIGEKKFFSTLNIFTTNTTQYRLMLNTVGKDWNETSDFELWLMLIGTAQKEVIDLFFDGIDFSNFQMYEKTLGETTQIVLYDKENKIEINEEVYQYIHQYFQVAFNMKPEEEFTKDPMLKKWWIKKDQREAERTKEKEEKGENKSSSIQALISACVNHPGFKYKLNELEEINLCQFYDSVKRLQIYESTNSIMHGMYATLGLGGCKNLKPDDYNFMKEI